jgi:hypothetical protein
VVLGSFWITISFYKFEPESYRIRLRLSNIARFSVGYVTARLRFKAIARLLFRKTTSLWLPACSKERNRVYAKVVFLMLHIKSQGSDSTTQHGSGSIQYGSSSVQSHRSDSASQHVSSRIQVYVCDKMYSNVMIK